MSQRALMLAVRDQLRKPKDLGGCNLAPNECEVQFDGMPPPSCGGRYVAIHEGDWRGNPGEGDLDESFGVDVTFTFRVMGPKDRIGPNLLVGPLGESLDEAMREVLVRIHMDPPIPSGSSGDLVRGMANAIIGTGRNGFVQVLRFRDADKSRQVGPEWFSAEGSANPPSGIVRTLHFVDARRVQSIVNASSDDEA